MKKIVFCPNCSLQIDGVTKFCPRCGARIKKKHTGLIIAGCVLAFLILIFGFGSFEDTDAAGNEDGQSTSDQTNDTGSSQPDEQEQTGAPEKEQEEDPVEEKGYYDVGEVADYEGLKVTLTNVYEVPGDSFNKPADGNVFLICEFEFDNQSDEDYAISSVLNFEAYCDDYSYTDSISAEVAAEKDTPNGDLAAGKKMSGILGYEVPADWGTLEIRYTPDFWDDTPLVFIHKNA